MSSTSAVDGEKVVWNTRTVVSIVFVAIVGASSVVSTVSQMATKGDIERRMNEGRAAAEQSIQTVSANADKAVAAVAEGVRALKDEAVKTREKLGEIEVNTAKTAELSNATNRGLTSLQQALGTFVTRDVLEILKQKYDGEIADLHKDLAESKADRTVIHADILRLAQRVDSLVDAVRANSGKKE